MHSLKIKWKDIRGTTSGRLSLIILLFMITIGVGFLTYTYNFQLESFTQSETAKLKGIAATVSTQINGDGHWEMFNKFREKDAIPTSDYYSYYTGVHHALKAAKVSNQLQTDIYTFVYDYPNDQFLFGVTSADIPYFRHSWTNFTKLHKHNFQTGGIIGPYKDENGIWLSAFVPIRNSKGITVAILQVDEPFGNFIAAAQRKIWIQLSIMIAVLAITVYIMIRFVQNTLRKDEKVKKVLSKQRAEIEKKNNEIVQSINRAKFIQDAILPGLEKMQMVFPEMFVMFQPRDIVSGDFFWWAEKDCRFYFAVADCTGHGVPGAFMSLICHTLLNEALQTSGVHEPGEILTELDKRITATLSENRNASNDGMDISLLSFDSQSGEYHFAGALRPLIKISKNGLVKYEGDKFSIGGYSQNSKIFRTTKVDIESGDIVYMFTDGYTDQFGGQNGKKYMSRRLKEFLNFINEYNMLEQQLLLRYEFHLWKEDEDQVDDILIAGIKIPEGLEYERMYDLPLTG